MGFKTLGSVRATQKGDTYMMTTANVPAQSVGASGIARVPRQSVFARLFAIVAVKPVTW